MEQELMRIKILHKHMKDFVTAHPRTDVIAAYQVLAQIRTLGYTGAEVKGSDVALILGMEKDVVDKLIRYMREIRVNYIMVTSHGEGRMRLNVEGDEKTYWNSREYIPVMNEHIKRLIKRFQEEPALKEIIEVPFNKILEYINEGKVTYAGIQYGKIIDILEDEGLKGNLKQLYYRGTANRYELTEKGELVYERIKEDREKTPKPA